MVHSYDLSWLWNVGKQYKYCSLYLHVCFSVKLDSLLCSFTSIFFFIARRMPLLEQDLLTLQEAHEFTLVLVGSCYSIFSFMCMFCRSLFVLFLLYVLLWYTDSDYPVDIFKLFLLNNLPQLQHIYIQIRDNMQYTMEHSCKDLI